MPMSQIPYILAAINELRIDQSEVNFHFFVVSNRGECQLPGTFFERRKYLIVPSQSYHILKSKKYI